MPESLSPLEQIKNWVLFRKRKEEGRNKNKIKKFKKGKKIMANHCGIVVKKITVSQVPYEREFIFCFKHLKMSSLFWTKYKFAWHSKAKISILQTNDNKSEKVIHYTWVHL